jgi:Beta-propeller repeat
MTTRPLTGRSHRRVRAAALVVAAATVPAFFAATLLRADSSVPPESEAPAAMPAANLPGSSGDLVFSSYLGGHEWDEGTGVATDSDGNSIISGFTLSEDFPVKGANSRGHASIAIPDAFVTKVAPDSGQIVWSTQLGGVDMDAATAVTVDKSGNVYVVGRTGSSNFPTVAALQSRLAGRSCTGEPCHDAFITKLNEDGRIVWSTYFGGTRNEEALGVAVDEDANVYLTGVTDSKNLPVRNAFQPRFQSPPCQGDLPCPYDGFVTKLAANGQRIEYSTYLGGNAADIARGIDVDKDGSAYVAGSTGSTDFPRVRAFESTTRGRHCGPPPGEPCRQAFLTKLSPNGTTAVYSTYLGGREHDDAYGVAVDEDRQAHVTGGTQSPDFPTRNAFEPALDNHACTSDLPEELCDDGFVTKFNSSGQEPVYSTYLAGRAEDQGLSIDVTRKGQALVGGRTDSRDFPVTTGARQQNFGGYIDGFAMKLRPDGSPIWSSFLGGKDADRVTGISADRSGAAHLTGRTLSPNLPTARPFQPSLKDQDYDAFLSVIK